MLAAHMKLPERILRHVGRLHDHLIEQRIVPARRRRDRGGVDRVGGCAGLGLDARAPLIQVLRRDDDRRQVSAGPPIAPSRLNQSNRHAGRSEMARHGQNRNSGHQNVLPRKLNESDRRA